MKKLWEATKDVKNKSNLHQFEKFISKKYNLNFKQNYQKILDWSTKNSPIFWDEVWNFCKVNGLKSKNKITKSKIFYKNKFLPNYKLNFTENLLVKNNKDKALTFISENGFREEKTWSDLNNEVSKIYKFLIKIKIKKMIELQHIYLTQLKLLRRFLELHR